MKNRIREKEFLREHPQWMNPGIALFSGGSSSPDRTVILTNVFATASVGAVATPNRTVNLTNNLVTTAVGSIILNQTLSRALTGISSTTGIGNTLPSGSGAVTLSGVQSTTAVGTQNIFSYGDQYFSNVVLLTKFEGVNGGTSFYDHSLSQKVPTVVGQTNTDVAQSKFGDTSARFDGTTDYLQYSDSTDWTLTGDFTVEFWFRANTLSSYRSYVHWNNGASQLWALYSNGTTFGLYVGGFVLSTTITTATWYHVAIVRSGSTIRMYLDGTEVGSGYTNASSWNPTDITIGANYAGDESFNGWIDELRITNGTARYTSAFTPTTTEFSADSLFDKVSLMVHGNGTNGSTTIPDSSTTTKTLTAVADAKISTAQSKFNGSSIIFDGTGDQITIPTHANFGFGSDSWCVESWIYPTSSPICSIFDTRSSGQTGANRFTVGLEATTRTLFCQVNSTVHGNSGTAPASSVWSHIAVTYDGTTLRGFVNGSNVWSATVSLSFDSTMPLSIGNTWDASAGYIGHMGEIRITKGQARYTSGFTVRNSPFPNA